MPPQGYPSDLFSLGSSAIIASVVNNRPAMDEVFCEAKTGDLGGFQNTHLEHVSPTYRLDH